LHQRVYLVRKSWLIEIELFFFFCLSGGTTPSTSTLQTSSNGTVHKFDAVVGVDKITKNSIQTQIRTKIFNLCAMSVYEKKSMEVDSMKKLFS
jgi:hypothetical protein